LNSERFLESQPTQESRSTQAFLLTSFAGTASPPQSHISKIKDKSKKNKVMYALVGRLVILWDKKNSHKSTKTLNPTKNKNI